MAISITPKPSGVMVMTLMCACALSIAQARGGHDPARTTANPWDTAHSYIVQSTTASLAGQRVSAVGGKATQELPIVNGVIARLTQEQLSALSKADVRVYEDRQVSTRGATTSLSSLSSVVLTDGTALSGSAKQFVTNYPFLVNAEVVHAAGITGKGITIAVLDTGIWTGGKDNFKGRIVGSLDLIAGAGKPVATDPYGHGTHVTSIASSAAKSELGTYFGLAPDANLVIVRAFDQYGAGSYANVIAGLNWIVANQQKYKIRVLNLSFGAPPQSNYWDDPLNQAVMAAWKAGIVVVVSAGNEGPDPMTIGVPGNVPYVITTGALTDNFTPYDPTDDRLASFSSTGPTFEGFVKPEVVAPGGHMVGSIWYMSYLANIDPGSMKKDQSLFTMSGTSQAAAVTSGVVALMLQANPTLSPDTVKCRLLATASAAVTSSGTLAYSVFQQGAGLVDAQSAIASTATGCANGGLNIAADLAGTQHFGGPANEDASGNYYIMNMGSSQWGSALSGQGYTWTRGYTWSQGYTWTKGYTWTNGYTWTRGYTWTKGYTWTRGYTWSEGYTWTRSLPWCGSCGSMAIRNAATPASIENWVPNE